MKLYLGDLLQPPSQRDEHEEHWWCIKEGDGVELCFLHHSHHQNDHRVGESYSSGQDY